ncbi:WG repeat-containing protein [Hymenobacter jejuensis]|uniref:WG repeat-containing protein n=1 Tax=Hymenobacter jejuensis TaxID=2502781 RepID=A0A5B7ZYS6_9BACT|nr:WG repeat-containing protein [Hymenobacter jejuensis]QDA60361.1 WG repeat-containing protein [Hymenobacter jejuensis]
MPGFRFAFPFGQVTAFLLSVLLLISELSYAQTAASRLIPFRRGDKWGYADRSRHLVLPLQYDEAGPFVGEVAWVRQGDRYGYIDGSGHALTPVQYTQASTFQGERATVTLNSETFDISTSGVRLTEPAPAAPDEDYLSQGDVVRRNGKVGFRFTVGTASIPAEYDEIRENYSGLLFVRQGAKWGVINSKGKVVQPLTFDAIRADEKTGFLLPVVARDGLFGYLDEKGGLLVEPQYRAAEPFVGNAARVVTLAGKVGYIDAHGTEFFED